ncbi:MAG TPA: ADOP family duplicated permease [Vicinamibacterales bacterium]|nr:ADOP family duplicated permease [Vicinamibacterales bacterium]
MSAWLRDLRLAARALRATPSFTGLAALLLALGIAGATTVFSIADAVLFRPFPFVDQARLVIAGEDQLVPQSEVSYRDVEDWRAGTHAFEDLCPIGSTEWIWDLRTDTGTVPVRYRSVGGNFFDLLGATPLLGRTFHSDDDRRGSARTIVLSDGFWRRQFGGDPGMVGRTITLSGQTFTVVGIMPAAFMFPAGTDVWTPLVPDLTSIANGIPNGPVDIFDIGVLFVVGRLKPGTSIDAARRDLNRVIADQSRRTHREAHVESRVRSIVAAILGPARAGVSAWLAAAVVLLLVACANVSGLMLVRAAGRSREYAIRLALGASRAALARLLLCEALIVSALASAGGLGLTMIGLPAIVSRLPADIPRLSDAGVNMAALGAAAATGLLAALASSITPAVALTMRQIEQVFRRDAATVVRTGHRAPLRRLLIAGELAAAVLLLTAAGLLARSVGQLGRLDLGFQPSHLLAVHFAMPAGPIGDTEARLLLTRALDDLSTVPGVISAAGVSLRPLQGPIGLDSRFRTERQTPAEGGRNPYVNVETITPGYFRTLGGRIVEGRSFTDADRAATMPVLIVSEGFARLAWPGEPALGKRLQVPAQDRGPGAQPVFRTIVGVAADMRYRTLEAPTPTIYAPFAQSPDRIGDFMFRTGVEPAALAPTIRQRTRALNGQGSVTVDVMDDVVSRLETPWRSNFSLFVLFAGLTVVLAAAGLYGLLAWTVTGQAREIGVRLVLGATPARIATAVVADGARMIVGGAATGLVAAALAARLMRSLLFDVSPLDPAALCAAPVLLAIVALAATALPAIRASRTEPAVCLRRE